MPSGKYKKNLTKVKLMISLFRSTYASEQIFFKMKYTKSCREEENLVFCFGAQFNSTLNFTQSGWHILFIPDLHFRLAKRVSSPNLSLQLETATGAVVSLASLLSDAFLLNKPPSGTSHCGFNPSSSNMDTQRGNHLIYGFFASNIFLSKESQLNMN